jgi:hypothetical protein
MPPFRGITPRHRGSRFYPRQPEHSGKLEGSLSHNVCVVTIFHFTPSF